MDHFEISHVHTRRRQSHLYAAFQKLTGRPVLLHVTNEDRAKMEVQALTILKRNERVLQMIDKFTLKGDENGNNHVIVYEYFRRSCILPKIMKSLSTTFNEESIAYIMQQLLLTLVDFQEMGIVHCDICASNMLIDIEGKVKVMQFGSAHRERGGRLPSSRHPDAGKGKPPGNEGGCPVPLCGGNPLNQRESGDAKEVNVDADPQEDTRASTATASFTSQQHKDALLPSLILHEGQRWNESVLRGTHLNISQLVNPLVLLMSGVLV